MKTTYVLEYKTLSDLKLQLLPKKKLINYFFSRDRMVRWEPETNKFADFRGLIDISFVRELIMTPEEAKKEVNLKNVEYLVRREQLSEYRFDEINEWGILWHVIGEDVKRRVKLFDEYHMVFDIKIVDSTPPFKFKTVFYGNIYDYLVVKSNEERGQ